MDRGGVGRAVDPDDAVTDLDPRPVSGGKFVPLVHGAPDLLHSSLSSLLNVGLLHPLEVVKRLYCYVKLKRPDLLHNLGFRPLGELLGEGGGANAGAAMQARCKALFGSLAVGAHKSATAKAAMTKAQKGNRNRRGGK